MLCLSKNKASAYVDNFFFSLNIVPIRGLQFGGASYSRQMAFNSISAFYRHRGFQFGIQWQNPLTSKANLSQTYYFSKAHPQYSDYWIKKFNNMVLFSVQYNVSFSSSYNKQNVNTEKAGVNEVIKAY